jgi:hypothetical protein
MHCNQVPIRGPGEINLEKTVPGFVCVIECLLGVRENSTVGCSPPAWATKCGSGACENITLTTAIAMLAASNNIPSRAKALFFVRAFMVVTVAKVSPNAKQLA